MIGKKVKNPKHSSSKSVRIQRLVDYVRNPEKKGEEKAVYAGTRGFVSEDERVQKQEMEALAHAAVRSRDPITHYVLSWREGEEPSPRQVERSVDLVLEELKMKGHQAVYAMHADTQHYHLHVVVNRVDPETERVVSPNRGKDIELLHRAVARIEKEQGWEREERGRYRVRDNGEVERAERPPQRERQPRQENRDREVRTGEKSAERVAQERGRAVVASARSWGELHERLGREGLRYEKKGSGAVLVVGRVRVKASVMGRECSLKALEKRLGPFVEGEKGRRVFPRPPEPQGPPRASWAMYQREKQAYEGEKRRAYREQKKQHGEEKREHKASGREQRDQLHAQDWKGRGRELNQARSLLAGEQAKKKAGLKERQEGERAALRVKYPSFPSFVRWRELKEKEREAPSERAELPLRAKNRLAGEEERAPVGRDIRDFSARVVRQEIRYQPKEEPEAVAFVDRSRRVDVYRHEEEGAVRAALQLAAEKWGTVKVSGKEEFVARVVTQAAQLGVRLADPELQARVEEERERAARSPREAEQPFLVAKPRQQDFER